jgi:hypothetical protein
MVEFFLEQEINLSARQDSGSRNKCLKHQQITSSVLAIGSFCDARHFNWHGKRNASDIQFLSNLKLHFDIYVRAL